MFTELEIKEKLVEILDELSLIKQNDEGDIEILYEEIDSIQLISIIVDIEEKFDIEIPDEYMVPEFISSLDHMVSVITELCDGPVLL